MSLSRLTIAVLAASSATAPCRDIVWEQSWSDELPLTASTAEAVPGGLAIQTLDGSQVGFAGQAPIAISPYRQPIFEDTELLGIDSNGLVLLETQRGFGPAERALVWPGRWSYTTEAAAQIAGGCSSTLWTSDQFTTLTADGRVQARPRVDLDITGSAGAHPGGNCRLFGSNSRGSHILLETSGIERPLGFRPLRWIGSWGHPIAGGYGDTYLGQDNAGRLHYVSRAPNGSETAVAVEGENRGFCLADGGPLQVYLIVHEQVGDTHRLRGFDRLVPRWSQVIPADARLAGCNLFTVANGVPHFQSINVSTGALGPTLSVIDNGQTCEVPSPSSRVAICNGFARPFSLGSASISFQDPLRYSAPTRRGFWIGAEETAALASFRLIERDGQLHGQISFLSPFNGSIQTVTPEQPLGLPYDPRVTYFPQLEGPLDAGRWVVALQRSQLDQVLHQIPVIFQEQAPAIVLRTAAGDIAEVNALSIRPGTVSAIQQDPARLLEWTDISAAPRETAIANSASFSGQTNDLVLIRDSLGSQRRLRALREGAEIWSRPIGSNCITSMPGDGHVYLFCPVNEVSRTVYSASRIRIENGSLVWTRSVASPNLNESTHARVATFGGGELRVLGNGQHGSGPNRVTYARLQQETGELIALQSAPADFSFSAVPDLPDGIAALIGSGSQYGRYMIRARPNDGINALPIANDSVELQRLLSNQGPRWYSSGRQLLRQVIEGRQRPFSLIPGQIGIQLAASNTPVDGFQNYRIRLTGNLDMDVGRIELEVYGDVAEIGGCSMTRVRYGNPTRVEIPTPAVGCEVSVRVATGFSPLQLSGGWYNTSKIRVSARQPYRFTAGTVASFEEINTGLRSGFEATAPRQDR
ncbi:MAG: hypothetical protein MUE46_14160 [Xanthomonadales bacterium]|jgi:hypothetical protein|nr:hypothetical protein [Xanthomonadales bacterium]